MYVRAVKNIYSTKNDDTSSSVNVTILTEILPPFSSCFALCGIINNAESKFCFQLFLLPQEWDLPTVGGIHYGFAWRCFPILGLALKFFGVDGVFPH